MKSRIVWRWIGLVIVWLGGACSLVNGQSVPPAISDSWRSQIETDWAAQEQRFGRTAESVPAVQNALTRLEQLIAACQKDYPQIELSQAKQALGAAQTKADGLAGLTPEERRALYHQLRWQGRNLALQNPLLANKPLVFMKRNRFVCQMLHEYLGYFYDYADISGGGIYVLEQPGYSAQIKDLIQNGLPKGNFTTLALSYDARTIYFAFAARASAKPDFYSPQRRSFHLYAMDRDGQNLRALTEGVEDDFDPCSLPDGGIAFMSTRRGGFGRCHNPWEPLPSYTLHRMEAGGQGVQTLSFHETNEWHPVVLNDGRIAYVRWDYVDRSAANFHGLWTSNPDGSNPALLFGNYTMRINACYQPRPIPGSDKVIFVAGAHHADVGGSLVLLDPKQTRLDAGSGEDDFRSLKALTPEVCFPEAPGWPKSYFHSPWPLSENHLLVSCSFDPLPGMGPKENRDTRTGLYYWDTLGNLELLYRDPEISSMYPIPLEGRPTPPIIPSALDRGLAEEGEFILADVQRSLLPLPADRPIKALRVFQVLPKTSSHVANQPRIGHANAESARMFLGTVPVETDGSAYFRVPARKPIYFQAVDEQGRAVQTMRSITYLQPGERRGCVGCHEPPGAQASSRQLLAQQRPPSRLEPGPDGSAPLSYPRLVQPVLDRACGTCHDGTPGTGKSKLALTGGSASDHFSRSYTNLKRYVRWHEWGGDSISQIATRPGKNGADESPLMKILDDQNHGARVALTPADRQRLLLWLDANVPFYGAYEASAQLAQRHGESVPPPKLQ